LCCVVLENVGSASISFCYFFFVDNCEMLITHEIKIPG
jgi:hypothetical protein